MSIDRSKDGYINNNNNNFVSIVSRVVKISDDKWDKKFQQAMQQYAKLVTACDHTFKEIEQYLLEQCDALPLPSNDTHMKLFQASVIMDSSKNRHGNRVPIFSNMTDEEIDKWHKERSAMFHEAQYAPPQQFGLNIHGYYLPHTERNKVFYDQCNKGSNQYVNFFFEETTGYYQFNCAGCSLMYQVIIFIGISEEDIKIHNQRLVGYINSMIEMGYLPNLIEER